jgi:hypothetical protein
VSRCGAGSTTTDSLQYAYNKKKIIFWCVNMLGGACTVLGIEATSSWTRGSYCTAIIWTRGSKVHRL